VRTRVESLGEGQVLEALRSPVISIMSVP
jgi:hypothetical protein